MKTTELFDFVIFGSGFGGSITSMILRRLGYTVLLLECGMHPRFVIGESSTPFANLLLEELARKYDLPFLGDLAEWGRWQRKHREIACGLKRGFTFYHHTEGKTVDFQDRRVQLLVAASPADEVADTHWYRPEFDQFLVQKATECGAAYLDRVEVEDTQCADDWVIAINRAGERQRVRARFVIDASGPSGSFANSLRIPSGRFPSLPATRAVYAHFRNVARLNTLSPIGGDELPYPVDDAAVHHVFEDGWIWVLRFNNGLTSAGAALKSQAGGDAAESSWERLLARFPTIGEQFQSATAATPFYTSPQLSFRRSRVSGHHWALLPSTVGFVDPLLSTGFALNLRGIYRLGELFERRDQLKEGLAAYEKVTLLELDATAELIGALSAKFGQFEAFAALTLLYFAALSYTETVWRLDKASLAECFLLADDPKFTQIRKFWCARALSGESIKFAELVRTLEPWDVAGLGDLKRQNWYPVRFEDLIKARRKVAASPGDVERLFAKLGGGRGIAS